VLDAVFELLVERGYQGTTMAAALDDEGADPAATLTAFATNLLKLLLGERSVALNPGRPRRARRRTGGRPGAGRRLPAPLRAGDPRPPDPRAGGTVLALTANSAN
jgi:hypothetical protein